MIVDAFVTVDGKNGPVTRFCTTCGAVIARGLDDIHNAWHRRHADTTTRQHTQ